jgi:signal peptidase I
VADDAAAPTAVAAPKPLAYLTRAALTPEQQRGLSRVIWHDRLVSLWAPVTVLALVFGVYLIVVESVVCASLWLQPVMQAVGLLAFGWWVALLVARLVLRRWNGARRARYHADEVVGDFERTADRHRQELKPKAWAELLEVGAALRRAYLAGEAEVTEATHALEAAFEKHLSRFRHGGWLDFGSGFVRALLIALAFRAVLIEPYKIPSGSMIPTLQIGDQIFVNKFIYGVRLPFTNYVPFVLVRPPRRGDVIVFNNPVHTEVDYVKRVVGIPGDRLVFDEAGVSINGTPLARVVEASAYTYWDSRTPLSESWAAMFERWTTDDWHQEREVLFRETLDGQSHHILDSPAKRVQTLSRMLERSVVVPEGHVFVMGDNRNNSEDSRVGLGDNSDRPRFVPYGNIKGKATVIWLSLSRGGLGSTIFGGTGIRYDRFFKSVSLCGSEPPLSGATPEKP